MKPTTDAQREQNARDASDEAQAAARVGNVMGFDPDAPWCHICAREHSEQDCPKRQAQPKPPTKEEAVAAAREKKARKLAGFLFERGYTIQDVREMNADQWKRVAGLVGCQPPHSKETVDAITGMLADLCIIRSVLIFVMDIMSGWHIGSVDSFPNIDV